MPLLENLRDFLSAHEAEFTVTDHPNAFTAREYTCFHLLLLDRDAQLGIDILGDVILNSAFDADELERAVSPTARDSVWLLTEPSADVRSLLDRVIGMEQALSTSEVVSREGQQFRRDREHELGP